MRNFLRYADVAELLQVKVGTLYSMVSRREISPRTSLKSARPFRPRASQELAQR